MTRIEIRLLGDPTVVVGDREYPVRSARGQAVLARLAMAAPSAVSVDALIDDVWGESPPASALDAVRVHVSNLRKTLAGAGLDPTAVVATLPGAYRLEVANDAVDVHRLEAAVGTHDPELVRGHLDRWIEHDVGRLGGGSAFFTTLAERIAELRSTATEIVAEADIAQGRGDRAARALRDLAQREPYRERAWELLVGALQSCERRIEAVRVANEARQTLAEVGMEPGPRLIAAERAAFEPGAQNAVTVPRTPTDYVDVDGSRVAFTTIGAHGTDLLFLHGGFVPFDVMPDEPRLAEFLQRLSERHRVILLDRRGIGMSDPPADAAPVSLDHWVADCRAVLDAVGSSRCHVLAHENGGPVAIRLAAEDPQRLLGLVLHSTVAKYLRSDDHPYGPTEDAYARINRIIDRVPGADDMLKLVAPSVGDDPGLRAWLERDGRLGAGPARAKELHHVYLGSDVRSFLGQVKAPVAVLQPARILRGDPGQARHLVEHLADAELRMLDSADHLPYLADADAVLDALDAVVARSARPDAATPEMLRALLGVNPESAGEIIRRHGPQAVFDLDHAVVAVFGSLASARQCAEALVQEDSEATTVVEARDTSCTADDPAVAAVAAAVRAARPA